MNLEEASIIALHGLLSGSEPICADFEDYPQVAVSLALETLQAAREADKENPLD